MRPLILLGASVRAAAFSASRAGFAPYGIDLFADRDLAGLGTAVKIARYPSGFLPALAAAPQATWIYSGGLENHPRLVDRLAGIRPLAGNPGRVLQWVRDPRQLMSAARDAGCDFPQTIFDAADTRIPGQIWLIKPRRSSGGTSIRFAPSAQALSPPRGTYLQQHIEGQAASAVFVAAAGAARLIGATHQILGRDVGLPLPFLYVGSTGPLHLSNAESARLCYLGNLLAARFGLVGLFNIDFVQHEDRLWIVEVNPRYSASMEIIERVHDVNLIDWHLRACESAELLSAASLSIQRHAGKIVVYARQRGIVPPSLDDLARQWNSDSLWPGLADLPRVGETLHALQPVVTVLADGDSTQAVNDQLLHRTAAIEKLLANS
jgi:predicted ATP-grasp superfamily ATP-dependent carboligase